MISKIVVSYLVILFLSTTTGLSLSFTETITSFEHEFRVAFGLNMALFLFILVFACSPLAKNERSIRLILWFTCYEFLSPVFIMWVYMFETYGNHSGVFYFAVCFLVVPLSFFCGMTGLAIGNFVFE